MCVCVCLYEKQRGCESDCVWKEASVCQKVCMYRKNLVTKCVYERKKVIEKNLCVCMQEKKKAHE